MDDSRTISVQPPLWMSVAVLLAVAIGGGFYVYGKKIEVKDVAPTLISVTGEGKANATPDIAELTFGIQIQRQPTAKAAMDQLGKGMTAVFEAVKKAGIEEKDISTAGLSLNPAYDWNEGRQIMRGFDASQSLRVKVRDLDAVSDVLAAATNAGANQAGGVSFIVDEPEKSRAEARQEAITLAQQKAQTLAKQLGMSLGELKSFNEGGGYVPPIMYGRDATAAMAEKSMDVTATPLPAGEQEVNVQVTLTYELR
ncbi:MAG: SIMPL domain-containing protein [Candidatus Peribacteraceae bacterium]|nr:SIMPL domain-containing protein [Candidatus Peribacteraceae bacterium]